MECHSVKHEQSQRKHWRKAQGVIQKNLIDARGTTNIDRRKFVRKLVMDHTSGQGEIQAAAWCMNNIVIHQFSRIPKPAA